MSVVQLAYANAPAPKGSAERGKDPGRRCLQGGAYLIATASGSSRGTIKAETYGNYWT